MKKHILITGSTDGIGKLLANRLASEGHTVYIHGRNPGKVNDLVNALIKKSGNNKIKGYVADFSDLDAVKEMATTISKDLKHIDVLINNAGIFVSKFPHDKNGLDIRLTVNYLAPYLLTGKLLPLLQKGNSSRIINLSSAAQSAVSLPALEGLEKLSVSEAYAQSKLALTMWSFQLAESHPELNVIAVNPGSLLNTKMAKEAYGQHWSPAEKGVNILHDLALSHDFKNDSGKYFDNDRGILARAHQDAYNKSAIKNLLDVTKDILK